MNTVRVLGELYARTYVSLAWNAVCNNELVWRVRPKFHIWMEIVLCRRHINPTLYSTWMDEDWLKKISHTLELTASKSAQHRTLQRWLLAIPEQIRQVSSNPS